MMMESLAVMNGGERISENGTNEDESFAVMNGGERISENGTNEDESPGDHIAEEMESFLLDIDERWIISRMVSDSVIKGMVNAVEEQAAERIAQKELEVVELKKMLRNCCVGLDETKMTWSSVGYNEPREAATCHFLGSAIEQDRIVKSVDSIKVEVHEQLNQLKKEINKIRGPSSIRRISSGSDLVGLGGILQENVPKRWIYVDKAFESLKDTLDCFCRRMEIMDQLSKASLSEWQEEQEFRSEFERMVIGNCICSLQHEFEQKLCDLCESESRNSFNQYKEISSLRQELDSLFKTLSVFETGQLISHGSLENTEDWCHSKRADHFHSKHSTDHLSPSTLEENGKHEESKSSKPDNLDSASLKDMSKDELITYITKMRRNHESQVQEKTEENFCLKGKLLNLKERGSSFSLKKDKDFDLLKKKIPDVISKLNEILVGNEKVHQFSENIESPSSLKDRLDFLHSENHQLKDMLADKKKEFKSLSSQLTAAMEKLSQQQLAENNLLQTIQKLEDDIEDAHAEVSVIQDVHKCLFEDMASEFRCTTEDLHLKYSFVQEIYEIILKETADSDVHKCLFEDMASEFRCITEDLHLKYSFMQEIYEIILKETADSAQASNGLEIEEADTESTLMQGLLDIIHVIFKEALVDADKALKLEASEKNKLRYEVLMLKSIVEEKENLIQGATDALVQEKRRMDSASEQLNSLRAKTVQQDELIVERSKELDVTKGNLVVALKEIEQYKGQMHKLNQNLEQRMNELREIDEERRELCAVTKKQQDALKCIEAKERENKKQMESNINLIYKLLSMVTDFEARVNEDISRNSMRLENTSSEFCCLNNKANVLKTMGLVYKQRFETKRSDLAKAEEEEQNPPDKTKAVPVENPLPCRQEPTTIVEEADEDEDVEVPLQKSSSSRKSRPKPTVSMAKKVLTRKPPPPKSQATTVEPPKVQSKRKSKSATTSVSIPKKSKQSEAVIVSSSATLSKGVTLDTSESLSASSPSPPKGSEVKGKSSREAASKLTPLVETSLDVNPTAIPPVRVVIESKHVQTPLEGPQGMDIDEPITNVDPLHSSSCQSIPAGLILPMAPPTSPVLNRQNPVDPQDSEKVFILVAPHEDTIMDQIFAELTPVNAQPAPETNPVSENIQQVGEVNVVDELISLLSRSSHTGSPLSARSSTATGQDCDSKALKIMSNLQEMLSIPFDTLCFDNEAVEKFIDLVEDLIPLHKHLPPPRRANFLKFNEFANELKHKANLLQGGILPFLKADEEKDRLLEELQKIKADKEARSKKQNVNKVEKEKVEAEVSRLEKELAVSKAKLKQLDEEMASHVASQSNLDNTIADLRVKAHEVVETIRSLQTSYSTAMSAKIDLENVYDHLKTL